jgi:cobalamin biosynthesis protein CobT
VPCLDIDFDEFNSKAPPSDSNGFCLSSDDDSSSSDDDTSDSSSDRWNADPDDDDNNHKDWEHFTKYKDWEDFEDFAVTLMRRCNIAQLDSFRLQTDGSRAPEFGNRVAAGWLRRAVTRDWALVPGTSKGCISAMYFSIIIF